MFRACCANGCSKEPEQPGYFVAAIGAPRAGVKRAEVIWFVKQVN
jgi:hypothetical protein